MEHVKKSNKLGFSLIELSLGILIVGILIAGISQGSHILYKSKLKSAQSLSASSPVNVIFDLGLWLDASYNDNIATGTIANNYYGYPSDNDFVVAWKDRSPNSSNNTIAKAITNASRPLYSTKSSNGLPAIKFNGSTSYLLANNGINYEEITIFYVVNLPSQNASCASLLSTYGGWNSQAVQTSVNCSSGYFRYSIHPLEIDNNNISVLDNSSHIITIRDDNINNKEILIDGAFLEVSSSSITSVKNLTNFSIGAWDQGGSVSRYLSGHISEIIIFSRFLKDSERQAVESYLSQKYAIKLR